MTLSGEIKIPRPKCSCQMKLVAKWICIAVQVDFPVRLSVDMRPSG